ncbi:MAG TPA: HDOD domain-containing protein [Thermodesulfobacteriaceae bacterium]|nr:HDOD domain-containing protein [Thermodesulfobacteriaceae bacterium]
MSFVKRLEQIDDLPSMPHTLNRVLESLDRISSSAETLEEIIRDDPVITAKILRMANSPYYGLQGEVSSIARAVVILGFEEVKNLVIGLALTGTFSEKTGFREFDARRIWIHSIGVARAGQMLAEHISGLDPDEIFTAGLLHDMGRFLLCLYFPGELRRILEASRSRGMSLSDVEESCGLSHAELGAYLAQRWNMSDTLVNTVRYHHRPASAGPDIRACSLVFLADRLCLKMKLGWSFEDEDDSVLVPRSLGLPLDVVKNTAKQLKSRQKQIEASWCSVLSG